MQVTAAAQDSTGTQQTKGPFHAGHDNHPRFRDLDKEKGRQYRRTVSA
jgi:hypothetical protein